LIPEYDPYAEEEMRTQFTQGAASAYQSSIGQLAGVTSSVRGQQAKAGFAGAGAGMEATQRAGGQLRKGYGEAFQGALLDLVSGIRGQRTGYQEQLASLLEAYGAQAPEGLSIFENGGGGDTNLAWGESPGYDPALTGPPGWASVGAYDQWVAAGGDPNNAVDYGWENPDPTNPESVPTGGCFIAGTGIDTSDGIVPIEILEIGDIVKTYDLKDKKHGKSKITETYKHEDVDGYIILNGIIKTTVYHPFYSDGKWIKAGELVIGDKILHVDGIEHSINSIDKIDDKVDVYNIEVDGTHNYFAEGYLVHNK
jgi:hypothetical protein